MISVEKATINQNATDSMPSLELRIFGNDVEELHDFAMDIAARSRLDYYERRMSCTDYYSGRSFAFRVATKYRDEPQKMPAATKIIFSGPATIVLWSDGTKTVVKCDERDTFDPEKGVALCYMKKMCGNFEKMERQLKKARKEYAKKHERE